MRPSRSIDELHQRRAFGALLRVPVPRDQVDHRRQVFGAAEVRDVQVAAGAAAAGRQAEALAPAARSRATVAALLDLRALDRRAAARILGVDLRGGRLLASAAPWSARSSPAPWPPAAAPARSSSSRLRLHLLDGRPPSVASPPSRGPTAPPRLICITTSGSSAARAPNQPAGTNASSQREHDVRHRRPPDHRRRGRSACRARADEDRRDRVHRQRLPRGRAGSATMPTVRTPPLLRRSITSISSWSLHAAVAAQDTPPSGRASTSPGACARPAPPSAPSSSSMNTLPLVR